MKLTRIVIFAGLVMSTVVGRADEAPFRGDITKLTEQNTDFRHVVFTGQNVQVVVMALPPGEDIGEEVHKVDQCFFFVRGTAQAMLDGKTLSIAKNDVLCVPAGTRHNIANSGREPLKLYTIYAPPQHPAGTVHGTKAAARRAEQSEEPHTGK